MIKTLRGLVDDYLNPNTDVWEIKGSRARTRQAVEMEERILGYLEEVGGERALTESGELLGTEVKISYLGLLDGSFSTLAYKEQSTQELLEEAGLSGASKEKQDAFLEEYKFLQSTRSGTLIRGARLLLLIAFHLDLQVPQRFLQIHGLREVTQEDLLADLAFDRALRSTTYAATVGEQELRIRIGEFQPEIARTLGLGDSQDWVYFNGWTQDKESEAALAGLQEKLSKLGVPFHEGRSKPDGGGPSQSSLLAALNREKASKLGRRFDQRAIVVRDRRSSELLWL